MFTFRGPIAAGLTDAADHDAVEITLRGLPADAVLSAGVRNDDGSWTLKLEDLEGLLLTTPDSRDFDLDVTARSTDGSDLEAHSVIHVTLLEGVDELGYLLARQEAIARFESAHII